MKKHIITLALAALALCQTPQIFAAEQDGQFIRTASTPAFETDFTVAAEKTVNAVVCIKSYASGSRAAASGSIADVNRNPTNLCSRGSAPV